MSCVCTLARRKKIKMVLRRCPRLSRKIASIDKSTRLVDFASCERAMKYAETFHNDEKIDGGVLPKSRAVWLDGRRCRIYGFSHFSLKSFS